jgi:putative phosphoesterase
VEIAIISDTHLPRGSRRLPAGCLERLRRADLIIHAGDFSTRETLDQLRAIGPVLAVHGNVDSAELRNELPTTVIATAGRHRIAVTHDAGPAAGRLQRLARRFPGVDAVVFGHSHIPLHDQASDGFQIFNPGSPTDRRRQPHHTMGVCRAGERLTFRLVTLD